jgi:hypothetical protein
MPGVRVVAPVEGLHHHDIAGVGGDSDQAGVGGVGRKRFLAEHVLPGLDRCDRPLPMKRRRRADVDGVDGLGGDQLGIRTERQRDAPRLGGLASPREISRPDRRDLDTLDQLHWRDPRRPRRSARQLAVRFESSFQPSMLRSQPAGIMFRSSSPSTEVRVARSCGSVSSSAGTNHGPIGTGVSQLMAVVIANVAAGPSRTNGSPCVGWRGRGVRARARRSCGSGRRAQRGDVP